MIRSNPILPPTLKPPIQVLRLNFIYVSPHIPFAFPPFVKSKIYEAPQCETSPFPHLFPLLQVQSPHSSPFSIIPTLR
jgi:hypothetical protein